MRGHTHICSGTFFGGELEPGTFHGGELEPGTFHRSLGDRSTPEHPDPAVRRWVDDEPEEPDV